MDFNNMITLIKTVSESSLTSFTLEDKEFKIIMKTEKRYKDEAFTKNVDNNAYLRPINATNEMDTAASATQNSSGKLSQNVIKSPLVGTFYSSASSDALPYVSIGDTVKKGQILGIVEAMKLMNEIECEYDGVVQEILIENEQVVEYGQPLFIIA